MNGTNGLIFRGTPGDGHRHPAKADGVDGRGMGAKLAREHGEDCNRSLSGCNEILLIQTSLRYPDQGKIKKDLHLVLNDQWIEEIIR